MLYQTSTKTQRDLRRRRECNCCLPDQKSSIPKIPSTSPAHARSHRPIRGVFYAWETQACMHVFSHISIVHSN